MHNIIIRPVVTEKSMNRVGQNKYTFVVARYARKPSIKNAIEKLFNVHVKGIVTIVVKGRSMRVGARRTEKKIMSLKRATVEIKAGEKIGIFEAA